MKNILLSVVLLFSFSLFAQNDRDISYLKITQKSCIKKKGNSVLLKMVVADSRCPEGVTCIWAGEVKVLVSVYKDREFIKEETLTVSGSKSQENIAWFAQYLPEGKRNIKGINVLPHPKKGVTINPKDYYIQLAYFK
jgi:hypothetical protein